MTTSNPALRLAEHVRACRIGDQIILLDLHRSKYIGLCGRQLAALSEVVLGESRSRTDSRSGEIAVRPDRWIEHLRSQGLLADEKLPAPDRRMPVLPEPATTMSTEGEEGQASIDWRQLGRLWCSALIASRWLRRDNLADVAKRVRTLRSKHAMQAVEPTEQAMRASVATYMHLRPLALTSHDRCLNDSLTLVHFLTAQGFVPRWVIGVRVHPFGAHSWVQCGGIVLNDLPERVRRYRPILVV